MTNNLPDQLPDPELVLRAAEEEPPQRLLDDYISAIHALRDKNFTFREIAEWLKKFGFDVDHNAVWRAYAKTVPEYAAAEAAERDDLLEREEAYRGAELNGTLVIVPPAPTPESVVETPTPEKAPKTSPKKNNRKKH